MSETPFLIREVASPSVTLPLLTSSPAYPVAVVAPEPPVDLRGAVDHALSALDTYARHADYRGSQPVGVARGIERYASPTIWTLAGLAGAAAGYLAHDWAVMGWTAALAGALGIGASAALAKAAPKMVAGKPLSASAVEGFVSQEPIVREVLSRVAPTVIADMTKRQIFGNAAHSILTSAAGAANPESQLSGTAERLAKLALALPSRFTRMDVLSDDQAMVILEAYIALTPAEQVVGRDLIRERLLETGSGPEMTPGVWQSLYDLTRPQPPVTRGEG